jgi:Flp pilus assembly pilin Flp
MKIELTRLYNRMQKLVKGDEGSGVTDVGLVVALVAVGATAGMNSVAGAINTAFTNFATTLTTLGAVITKHM